MAEKRRPQFLRRVWYRHSKLGKGRKKKMTWRKPTGRHNKLRENKKGKPAMVSIGYRSNREHRKEIQIIKCIRDLEKIDAEKMTILGKIGNRKKIELVKKAKEKGIKLYNVNSDKFLKKMEKKNE